MPNQSRHPTFLMELTVEPKFEADQGKLCLALQQLAAADPLFGVVIDPESGMTVLKGVSETHLGQTKLGLALGFASSGERTVTDPVRSANVRHMTQPAKTQLDLATLRALPKGIWALGFVSLLMDISSEMIHALLPLYLVTVLGASALTIGIIEGIAEATASVVKIFSGALSDWLGKRKLLVALGYGLAALTKPVFPLAPSIGWLFAARFIDRIGKGIRGAPRDALIADIAPEHLRGASFGLRQSLDTVGAFIGPLLAILLMWLSANNFTVVFWFAVIPAALSMAFMIFGVQEPERPAGLRKVKFPFARSEFKNLGTSYWSVVAVAIVFTLARFSEAFLLLKAQAVGMPVMLVPAVMVVMNVVYAAAAYPAGVLSENGNRVRLLVVGLLFLVAADLVLAFASGVTAVMLGVALWGLHMGFTQGLLSTLIADTAPPELRGTAYGIYNLLTGLALLAASMIAGGLWDWIGPQATFLTGAAFTVLALGVYMMMIRKGSGRNGQPN